MLRLLLGLLFTLPALGLAAAPAEHNHAHDAVGPTYQCPMHPWIKSDHPGKCTICGMDLVAITAADSTAVAGTLTLSPSSVSALGVQTSVGTRPPLTRT